MIVIDACFVRLLQIDTNEAGRDTEGDENRSRGRVLLCTS